MMDSKRTILIVDDSPGPRSALKMILKPFYSVHTAADGWEALRLLREGKIDLMTLDLEMPGMSGFDLLREIKRLEINIPVIIVTAHNDWPKIREVIAQGATNFLSKPFTVNEVITVVDRAFAGGKSNLTAANLPGGLPSSFYPPLQAAKKITMR